MRLGGSNPPSNSGMPWLKQKEQQGGWSDIETPGSDAFQDHLHRVVECLTRGCQLVTGSSPLPWQKNVTCLSPSNRGG